MYPKEYENYSEESVLRHFPHNPASLPAYNIYVLAVQQNSAMRQLYNNNMH